MMKQWATKETKAVSAVLLALSVLFLAEAAFAQGTRSLRVRVSAYVLAHVSMDVQRQVAVVQVTEEDIQRGYVLVSAATVYRVRANTPAGYVLNVQSMGGPFSRIVLIEGGREVELASGGGLVHMPYQGGKDGETKELGFRFYLAQNVAPGTYSWPLSLRAETY
ncbi:MAG: hypothetical protein P8Y66_05465 [Nitrospirota bacterium]|jgi:hypothetical protein